MIKQASTSDATVEVTTSEFDDLYVDINVVQSVYLLRMYERDLNDRCRDDELQDHCHLDVGFLLLDGQQNDVEE
jgi:hypothetical protein